MFPFQNLDVYKMALDFTVKVKVFQKKAGAIVDTSTSLQLRRASVSIPLNIAEGSGRFTKPDRRKFAIIARSSVFECVSISPTAVEYMSLSFFTSHLSNTTPK